MIYEFTEEELKSNKRGFFSPEQRKMIDGMAKGIPRLQWWNAKIAIIFPFLGLCIILGLSLSNVDSRTAFFADPTFIIALVLLVPLLIGIFALSIYFAYRRADKLSSAKLSMVEGKVELDESYSSSVGRSYYVVLNGVRFAFAEDVSEIFREGERYRVYYCEIPALKLIMSYEKIA